MFKATELTQWIERHETVPLLKNKAMRLVVRINPDLYDRAVQLGIDVHELTRLGIMRAVAVIERDQANAKRRSDSEMRENPEAEE
jgi:hypothetical protein